MSCDLAGQEGTGIKYALLLNSWYFPSRVVPWQAAIKMTYEQRVDVLVSYDEEISSPSVTWQLPAVIRQKKTHGKKRRRVSFSRRNVFLRDKFRCQYCSVHLRERDLTLDHVIPKSQGGQRTWENLVTACRPCNRKKANLSCDEAGMFPLQPPVVPQLLPVLEPSFDLRAVPEEWLPFLTGQI